MKQRRFYQLPYNKFLTSLATNQVNSLHNATKKKYICLQQPEQAKTRNFAYIRAVTYPKKKHSKVHLIISIHHKASSKKSAFLIKIVLSRDVKIKGDQENDHNH